MADVSVPIIAVNGLNDAGYVPVLCQKPDMEQFKNYITNLIKQDGLYYVSSWNRRSVSQAGKDIELLVAASTSND